MFFPEQQVRVFLYGAPVDMRRSFDGLYAIARHGMPANPLAGHLFAFINRRATQIMVLYFDRSGWCVWADLPDFFGPFQSWRTASVTSVEQHCSLNSSGVRYARLECGRTPL